MNFSEYKNVFCDSIEAIEWAYKNKLPKDATIKSGSPFILWNSDQNIVNIESRWSTYEANNFKSSILKLTEDVFNSALGVDGVDRELALTISKSVLHFHRNILYKAACLTEDDFNSPRLFIYVNGKSGPAGNMMNSPWSQLLSSNPLFSMTSYTIKNDRWDVLSTDGVPLCNRLKVAGIKTVIYRLAVKLMKNLPYWLFTKELFMPNENELNIEIASSLSMKWVKITEINLNPTSSVGIANDLYKKENEKIYRAILPIMRKKVEQWVTPSAIEVSMSLFKSHVEGQIDKFHMLSDWYKTSVKKNKHIKYSAVLMNAPGNVRGYALSYVCRRKGIPFMSSQHGVTVEMSKAHNMYNVMFDSSVSDVVFSYNRKVVDVESNTKFNHSKHYIVGMPMRLIGMKHTKYANKPTCRIVYISTNLYQMGFSISSKTDYMNARDEQKLVSKVLSKLPYKVCYKTYPADNRRYADTDPVLNDVKIAKNMNIFSNKVDMRYLISEYNIFVTTGATSTLGWPVMSGKPVIFIDNKNKSPLTDDAYESFSKGMFVFDSEEENFHEKLRVFLSQSFGVIEEQWQDKKFARKKMIRKYFSEYEGGAGERATKIILKEYLS
jgi:hypothetical protein